MHMDPTILDAEAALKKIGVSINEVCRLAGVDRSVWTRARRKQVACRQSTIDKLKAAIVEASEGRVRATNLMNPKPRKKAA